MNLNTLKPLRVSFVNICSMIESYRLEEVMVNGNHFFGLYMLKSIKELLKKIQKDNKNYLNHFKFWKEIFVDLYTEKIEQYSKKRAEDKNYQY